MNFKNYINEAAGKAKAKKPEKPEETTAVMAFGRMNPPTVGHEKLIQKLGSVASEHGGEAHLFTSHSQGTAKDPLDQKTKIGYLHSITPASTMIHGSSKEEPTIFHAAAKLHKQGHMHLVVVAGSDRVEDFQKNLERYNDGKQYPHGSYKFKSIKVVSAGQRDPDAEGVEGMSGTKMRDHARLNNVGKFSSGLPEALKPQAQEIANHIRSVKVKGVDIKEDYENPHRFDDATPEGTAYMQKMTPGQKVECLSGVWSEKLGTCVSVREAYIQNEIFKLNDVVEATNGDKGPIVFRGSSYVTIQVKENKTVKHWLKNIQEVTKLTPEIIQKPLRKIMEKQIPALFLSKEQLAEMHGTAQEKNVQTLQKVKETITMKDLRNKIAETHMDVSRGLPDTSTAHRDVNLRPDKEVYHGIDHTIGLKNFDGKELGLVSFKSFLAAPETAKIEKDKSVAMQDAHRAKAELAIHSSAYNLMRKYHQSDLP